MLLSSEIFTDWLSSFNSAALFDGCHSQILFYFETIIKMHVCLWISMRLTVLCPCFMYCLETFLPPVGTHGQEPSMQKVHSGCRTANGFSPGWYNPGGTTGTEGYVTLKKDSMYFYELK